MPTLSELRLVVHSTPEPRMVVDDSDSIRIVNEAACDLLGYGPGDLVGHAFDLLVRTGDGQGTTGWLGRPSGAREWRALGRTTGVNLLRADDAELPVELGVAQVLTEEGAMVIVSLDDTSGVSHDSQLFRALLESGPDAVVIVDTTGTVRMINEAAERCFGYDRVELVGQRLDVLVPPRFRSRHDRMTHDLFQAPRGRPMGHLGTLYAAHKDGHEFPVDISLAPVVTEAGPLVVAAVRDLTERMAAMAAMRKVEEQKRVLEETNRAKDRFLATVSHELRTPLASILGYCELITDRDDLDPEVEHFMSILARNARREARLVEDLLMLVDINEGRPVVTRREPGDLVALVRHAVESAQPAAVAAGVAVVLDPAPDALVVACDADRLSQVLDCLLSNAIKFTPPGGQARVRVWADAGTAWTDVRDTGPGIGDDQPHRVFERLYRSPTAVEREIPGAGLGLSIAAAIVAAHGGTIEVVDTSDSGTTFRIGLPLMDHR